MFKRLINPIISDSFFIFGARGTGKTTFLKSFFTNQKVVWIDLLDPSDEDLFLRRPEDFAARLSGLAAGTWIVIDEIQKVPKLLNVVHRLIEEQKLKFALTGSSARRLKQKGVNLLAGRAFTNYCFPLTHIELADKFSLQEVLKWGSLPRVIDLGDHLSKAAYLRSYALNYVTTEVQAEQWVRNIEPFRRFLPIVAQMNGKVINYAKIARDVGVDTSTIVSYFDILEDTLLGFRLEGFHESVRKRQSQKPKFYVFDLGVKRALEQTLTVELLPQTFAFGDAFEHFVVCENIRLNGYQSLDYSFSYLRTKDDVEVDLVIDRPGKKRVFVEIKSSDQVSVDDCKSLIKISKNLDVVPLLLSRDPNPKTYENVRCLPWQEGLKELYS